MGWGFVAGPLVALALAVGTGPLAGQVEARDLIRERTGQEVSQDEILERLQRSGMTRSQVRNRLLGMGLDPALADPYFDRLEGRTGGALPGPDAAFVSALSRMGLLEPGVPLGDGSIDAAPGAGPVGPRPDSMATEGDLPVFGKATFARRTSQFRPLFTGPAPPDYRLGPGDEVVLVLTGDVELAYTLPVSREGTLVIPDLGQVVVNGLTLAALEDRLYDRLGQVYSGVRRGADATTRFQVSLGRLRLNEVFVIGDVEYPGAYEVSSLGTVLGALYDAGGPTVDGSFRRVQVRRGATVVAEVDLYDYLLGADTRGDVRLEHGDVVFVPIVGPRVRVQGAVRRNAVFELADGESLADALRFAGHTEADADLARVRIDRILPASERTEARERVLLDVDVGRVRAAEGIVPLRDGDRVSVPVIGNERRDRVVLTGSVFRPGAYEFVPGMTVDELVARGGGLRPEAFEPLAHVTRLNPADSTYTLLRVALDGGGSTAGVALASNLPLQDQDSVMVFGRATLETPRRVRVEGEVKRPGEFRLAEGMTVEDVILSAGGFTERAQGLEVEVARLEPGFLRQPTVARTFSVSMEGTIPWRVLGRDLAQASDTSSSAQLPAASQVTLMEGDRVIVRPLPGWVTEATVEVQGEVQIPGRYPLLEREERLSSLVRRAGGLTQEAYVDGANLLRDSTLVGIDLRRVLAAPHGDGDVVLRPGDVLRVPLYDGTVLVRGAVAAETRVIYDPRLGFRDYLDRAGGALAEADVGRASILYANGARATVRGRLLFFTDHPDVEPGSTIFVPYAPETAGTDWNAVVTRGLGILASVATIVVAFGR
jgi:polysaccharide biosynthesis/export protein